MLTFHQRSGLAYINDSYLATGWAGQREGRNNPDMQDVSRTGPLPRGSYTIGEPYIHPHLGPFTFDLTPDPTNDMCGRSLFRIHGAAFVHPELSSEGCIILPRVARENISLIGEHRLEVKE